MNSQLFKSIAICTLFATSAMADAAKGIKLDNTNCHYQIAVNDPNGRIAALEVTQDYRAKVTPETAKRFEKKCIKKTFSPHINEDNGYSIEMFDKTPVGARLSSVTNVSKTASGVSVYDVAFTHYGENSDCVFFSSEQEILIKTKNGYPKNGNDNPNNVLLIVNATKGTFGIDVDEIVGAVVDSASEPVTVALEAKDSSRMFNGVFATYHEMKMTTIKGTEGHECPGLNGKVITINVK